MVGGGDPRSPELLECPSIVTEVVSARTLRTYLGHGLGIPVPTLGVEPKISRLQIECLSHSATQANRRCG